MICLYLTCNVRALHGWCCLPAAAACLLPACSAVSHEDENPFALYFGADSVFATGVDGVDFILDGDISQNGAETPFFSPFLIL